ncbi:MAG: LytTR family transcriptional regulator DNA-binding domain-containing protein [Reichenbachiella sp.]|uniref:LytR/AlgR family response regulator transcription factor n=1 Tax=Reichenbachiella sp. TaxID=2184521 RepID=UPI003266AB02
MKLKWHAAFWIAVYVALILLYGNAFEGYLYSIYFVSILFPVVIGTAYCFNFYLVPKYLMVGRKKTFILYFVYLLIVAAYLQIVMIFLAFIYLANYQVQSMHPSILDVSNLSVTLFAIVFAQGFFILIRKYQKSEAKVDELHLQQEKTRQGYLIVRSDRKHKKVNHGDILYVESFSDYVKIHIEDQNSPVTTKAKISHIENELPANFLRIHRSFIVNVDKIATFNSESVTIGNDQLTISRTYQQKAKSQLIK